MLIKRLSRGYHLKFIIAVDAIMISSKYCWASNSFVEQSGDFGKNSELIVWNLVLLILVVLLGTYIFVFQRLKARKALKIDKELAHITSSMHVGFVNFEASNFYNICYASQGFYDMIGYSSEEIKKLDNSMISFINPLDKRDFLKIVYRQNDNIPIQEEIRLICSDGKVIWTLMNGNYVKKKNDTKLISAVFVDITESKKMSERISLEQERYKVATEISNDILFEYNMEEDVMIYANKFEELCGKSATIYNFSRMDLKRTDLIYPEDRGMFSEYIRALRSGQEIIESEFRMISVDKTYVWCHTKGKTIYDEDKRPIRVIGKIANIDLHKRELQNLEYKAKRDPLTGVYNKSVTKELIDSFIVSYPKGNHIFMIIDIDDFKGINDRFGHHQGDKILTFTINQVKKIYNSGEILGRIGGDEFVVFIGNVFDEELIKQKALLLQETLRTCYSDEFCRITLSGSIGISQYPNDGANYNELLMCADKALYTVKGEGKDGYRLYECEN